MRKGDTLALFYRKAKGCPTYNQAVDFLRNWYNYSEKEIQLLTEWQKMTLTMSMDDRPDDAVVVAFRYLVEKLMSLQKRQLDESYHGD